MISLFSISVFSETIWLEHENNNTIKKINTSNPQLTTNIVVGGSVISIAVDLNGNLWFLGDVSGMINGTDNSITYVSQLGTSDYFDSIVIDSNNNVITATGIFYNTTSNTSTNLGVSSEYLSIDKQNNVFFYVEVNVYYNFSDNSQTSIDSLEHVPSGWNAVDLNGTYYATGESILRIIHNSTGFYSALIGGNSQGITIDRNNNVIYGYTNNIYLLNTTDDSITTIATGIWSEVQALYVAENGDIYVGTNSVNNGFYLNHSNNYEIISLPYKFTEARGDTFYDFFFGIEEESDTTPPSSVTGLTASYVSNESIYWEWTNPVDLDFNHSEIYIEDVFLINTSDEYLNYSGLTPETNYTIKIWSVDTTGYVNNTDVTNTQTTLTINEEEVTQTIESRFAVFNGLDEVGTIVGNSVTGLVFGVAPAIVGMGTIIGIIAVIGAVVTLIVITLKRTNKK